MAELAIISETGLIPHSACRCTFGTVAEWYGFAPILKHSPRGPGKVHTDDQTQFINHMIEFSVPDGRLRKAIDAANAEYAEGTLYFVGYRDCVSYSAQLAREAGLWVPPPPNMTPWGLIQCMRINNYIRVS